MKIINYSKASVVDRFKDKIQVDGAGCWVWAGAHRSFPLGRGYRRSVRQAALILFKDMSLNKGVPVTVTCPNNQCVNPEHLTLKMPEIIAIGQKTKLCGKCKRVLELFYFNKSTRADGYNLYCTDCNSTLRYSRSLDKEKYCNSGRKERRDNQSKLLEYLKDKKCVDCPVSNPICLEFDHLDRFNKKNAISNMVSKPCSWSTILAEIAKCEIVCSNCHKVRTATRGKYYKWQGSQ